MSALSKRQQARNEKALQELVQNVPGNNMCADCHARNPSWASWSLGVFLCMRCAAIHRKLGTHISKVKSLSMDSWSNEQVDNMRKVGNVASNSIYNSENRKPPVPVDADEADSAMERFIRQKYMNNVANGSGRLKSSPNLDEGTPPPLPPKNSTKFGFRSASSIFPLSSRARKEAKMAAAAEVPRSPSPKPANKPSKVFGASLDYDQPDDTDMKLSRLREMGFQDSKRNALVLKGVNGNMDRAIETLIRLGEGDGKRSPLPAPPQENTLRTSRSLTRLTPGPGGLGLGAGLSITRTTQDRPTTPSSASTNPFDMFPAQPQTAQSTGTIQNRNPYSPTNPFGAPASRPNDAFSQAFQNMTLSPPQQPLFPNRTGGPAPLAAQPTGYVQQAPAPSAPASPRTYQSMNFGSSMTYPQPMQPQQTGYNPFFSNPTNPLPQQPQPQQQQQIPQSNLSLNTNPVQGLYANNPFARSPTRIASPSLGQIPEQMQSAFQSRAPLQPQPTATNPFFSALVQSPAQIGTNPFGQPQAPQPQYSQQSLVQSPFGQQQLGQQQLGQQQLGQQQFGQQQFGQQPFGQQPQHAQPQPQQVNQYQQQQYYQPQRADNASIMALFNHPQLAPQKPVSPQSTQPTQPSNTTPSIPENQALQTPAPPVQQVQGSSQPLGGSKNPFMPNSTTSPVASDPFGPARSRESMNLGMDMAWTNGRHSPDAFASLSARHG